MTRITYIHAVPSNENAQRGQEVTQSGFIPYLSLTTGEMRLMLARQRAKIYAQFYPDFPQYRKALTLIDNALNRGVSNGVNFVGAIPDYLQDVARMVQSASRQTAPASRSGFFARPDGGVRGIGAIIPYEDRKKACIEAAKQKIRTLPQCKASVFAPGSLCDTLLQAEINKCNRQMNIEKIFNDAIEGTGHHVLYHKIPDGAIIPQDVKTKRLFHLGGVEGMAVAGSLQKALMQEWVENGIIAKNAQIGAGPINSIKASVQLAHNPDEAFNKIIDPSSDKWRSGVQGIGQGPAAAIIIGAIASALAAAKGLIEALRKQQATIAAQSFGTAAYSGSTYDWETGSENPETSTGMNTKTLLLLGGAAALLLLTNDEK